MSRPGVALCARFAAAAITIAAAGAIPAAGEDAAPAAAESSRRPPPVAAAAWAERDADARWVLYKASEGSPDAWARFLAEQKDWPTLEWIALTSRSSDAMLALESAKATNWMRCAVWRLRWIVDSHGIEAGRTRLEAHAAEFLAWLAKNPQADEGPVAALAKSLRASEPQPGPAPDVSGLLPALELAAVFADLSAPCRVEELAPDAKRAQPGAAYVHRAARALDALLATRLSSVEPWLSRHAALLRHASPSLRRAAALGYARVLDDLVPVDVLLALVDDPAQPQDVRSAALVGASYSSHPKAYVRLCDVALDPHHVAWTAAISRLQDVNDEFVVTVLAAAKEGAISRDQAERAGAGETDVRSHLLSADPSEFAPRAWRLLERAAWAEMVDDPLRGRIGPFVRELLRRRAADAGFADSIRRAMLAGGSSRLLVVMRVIADDALGVQPPPK